MIPVRRFVALLCFSLLSAVSLPAQNALQTISEDLKRRMVRERAEAESLAVELRMPIRAIRPDGTVLEIKRLKNGRPVYFKTDNVNAGKTISTDKVYPGGVAGYSLTGSGIVLGEWDGGGVRTTHQEFGGRVLSSQGTANFHSTHVAGTMIGSGANPSARGMSYAAQLRAFDWTNDISEMATQASAGLRASNHSYGLITGWEYNYFNDNRWAWFGDPAISATEDYSFGYYDTEAQDWDNVAWNAPYYLIVKSAGNDRNDGPGGTVNHWVWNGGWTLVTVARSLDGNSGYDCISSAGVAKNPLIVGAVGDLSGGWASAAGVTMSSFSGWGPTDDGRIKPDVVANGVSLFSSLETSNTAYGTLSGTSMATPSVTGSIGLILQHQQNINGGDSLLASTVKGLILHTADEAGTDPGPDYRFGWGLMNTRKAIDLMTLDTVDGRGTHINEYTMSTGDTVEFDFASTGAGPLRATISWTDNPVGLAPASLDPPNIMLRNDFDVRIIRKSDNAVFNPWILNPASPSSAATTGDNIRDNVEQIHIDAPGTTLYTLRITHKGTLYLPPRMISLIMSGNVMTPGAAISTAPDSVSYSLVPGATFTDSFMVYNTGDSLLTASIEKDPGSFWLSLTEDTINVPSLDSAAVHFSVNGALWSQWTSYGGSFTIASNDQEQDTLVIPVAVDVRGPTIAGPPGSYFIDLDSAEIGSDTMTIRNTGYIPLDVIVSDTAGSFPPWLSADPDTLSIPAGDSAEVVLTTNAFNEPLGDYYTRLRIANNDSVTGNLLIPFYLNIGTRTLVQIDVTPEWNLVSLPVEPITGLKSDLFPTAVTAAFGFDSAYYQDDTLEPGPGYWIKFSSAQSFDVDGYTRDADTIPLADGWNLFGSMHEAIAAGAVTTDPSGIFTSDFYAYDGGYTGTDSIRPGRGYWVQTNQAGNMILSVLPGAVPKAAHRFQPSEYHALTVADGSGRSQTLYFSDGEGAPPRSALPPRPPAGGFDTRFSDDRMFASFSADVPGAQSKSIMISTAPSVRSIRLSAAMRSGSPVGYAILDASGAATPLEDGTSLTIPVSEGGLTTVRLTTGAEPLPTEYALAQNYPNPFNPATSISFALPADEDVTIRIYNILGNEVGVAAARRFTAGRHTVEFDASKLPSGVYIYTMRAGAWSESRKMVLMR